MIEVVLRRARRMVGMRMVEPEQLGAAFRGATLRGAIIVRANPEPPARALIGHVRQRKRAVNHPVATDERAAALVGIGLSAVPSDRLSHSRFEM